MAPPTAITPYTSLETELADVPLPVRAGPGCDGQAALPAWLAGGVLVRNGPALWEIGKGQLKHFFDGQAMLHSFAFKGPPAASDGDSCGVSYSNRLLDTTNLRAHRAAGKVAMSEFGTDPCSTLFGRLASVFRKRTEPQNANVSVQLVAGRAVALTETPLPIEFEPGTLQTLAPLRFATPAVPAQPSLKVPKDVGGHLGHLSTAHPHEVPADSGKQRPPRSLNYITRFGRQTEYIIYYTDAGAHEGVGGGQAPTREMLARIPTKRAAYMHSFGMSERFVILTQFPWLLNVGRMVKGLTEKFLFGPNGETVLAAFDWKPERGTIFTVVDKVSGEVVATRRAEAFFAYHHINSFEDGDLLHVDLMCYDKPKLDGWSVEHMRSGAVRDAHEGGQIRRYTLDLSPKSTASTIAPGRVLCDRTCELPKTNYDRFNTCEYQFVYGVGNAHPHRPCAKPADGEEGLVDVLLKADVRSNTQKVWCESGCSPGEPIFVGRPGGLAEDDGVVLSVVFEEDTGTSFLLVLDAASFTERCRCMVPQHIPTGIHGRFFNEDEIIVSV